MKLIKLIYKYNTSRCTLQEYVPFDMATLAIPISTASKIKTRHTALLRYIFRFRSAFSRLRNPLCTKRYGIHYISRISKYNLYFSVCNVIYNSKYYLYSSFDEEV